MIPYASHPGMPSTRAAMRAAGWRILLSASGHHGRWVPDCHYALDNGAFSAWLQKKPWNEVAFLMLVERYGAGADWVVVPDVVAGGVESLRFSERWLPRLDRVADRRLVAVQDGMKVGDVAGLLGPQIGVFVGGTVEWKLATLDAWANLAHKHSAWCHVGRVNSIRRIRLCLRAGAHSFDGTSVTQFPCTLGRLDNARNRIDRHGQTTWVWR